MAKLKNTNQHAYDWLKGKNPTDWSMSHFSIRSQSDMNWDLTGIPCKHIMVVIHLKDEYLETYVQTWYTKQNQSNFIKPIKGLKQWESVPSMLPVLPSTLRRYSKCKRLGHNKRSCRREVDQNILFKRYKVGVHNQIVAPTQQEATPTYQEVAPTCQQAAPREKLPFKRKPTTVRWMSSTQK
ncbi:hypothetical protein GOBAR_AA04708 [Gossypium barbadense]|uniref:Zinc finger PMZ-type domain-containing protein n=1 Tax=Gossypium barbadense TaxID=3634 RepID=A0A2P5YJU2_GOSBA|nr:hypothetical protein GOBAR_AA04708 [Gossypium barbadense]